MKEFLYRFVRARTVGYFNVLILKFGLKNYNHTYLQPQKHSAVTSQTEISVIRSQNQQQPIVFIQKLFQHSSQLECSPADVG